MEKLSSKMKLKSLFRRKASPTGTSHDGSTLSPPASPLSHSSSSSSITSPFHAVDGCTSSRAAACSPVLVSVTSPAGRSTPVPVHMSAVRETAIVDDLPRNTEFQLADSGIGNREEQWGGERNNWDSQSRRSSESEVSLACLQGRIQQMEETHHSTNEELQATLQELADLQLQLTEMHGENDALLEEKAVLRENLQRVTSQLQEARNQIENLRQHLLLQCSEFEDERKGLVAKQTALTELLATQQAESAEQERHVNWLQGRVRHLETLVNEGDSKLHGELSRSVKEVEKLKLEKEAVENSLAVLQEQLSSTQKEAAVAKEQVTLNQEEIKTLKQKSSQEIADLEYKIENLLAKKQSLIVETGTLHAAVAELETACRRHLEDKREMRAAAAEQQQRFTEAVTRKEEAERILAEERAKWEIQQEEWQQFQKDLLTTVRVANDFKMDTLAEVEKVSAENKEIKEKNAALQAELDRYRTAAAKPRPMRSLPSSDQLSASEMKPRAVATRVDSSPLSVKRLVENLEPQSRSRIPEDTVQPRGENRVEPRIVSKPTRTESLASEPTLPDRKDPLLNLVKNGGSRRNALLKWCQNRTSGYANIDITNFSSSWNDGLALCALLHTFLPESIPFSSLNSSDVRRNFELAFRAAESIGIPTTLDINELTSTDRPNWQSIMAYITSIYKHFET